MHQLTDLDVFLPNQANPVRLYTLMSAFGINRFMVSNVQDGIIEATVGWPSDGSSDYDPDEETQQISWRIERDFSEFYRALALLILLVSQGILDNDRIAMPMEDLKAFFLSKGISFPDIECAAKRLLEVRIVMIDSGEKTDCFFLHF